MHSKIVIKLGHSVCTVKELQKKMKSNTDFNNKILASDALIYFSEVVKLR